MARLVPPGSVVNMGIEDPLDKLTKTIDLVTKVGSYFQVASDRKNQNHMENLESVLNMMNTGSQFLNVETATQFKNQLNIITEEEFRRLLRLNEERRDGLKIGEEETKQARKRQKAAKNFADDLTADLAGLLGISRQWKKVLLGLF